MHKLFFIIGASGSGKTTIIKALEKSPLKGYKMLFFDSIGIPSYAEMLKNYGSPEEFQRLKTLEWVTSIKTKFLSDAPVILDGQIRPQFIQEACNKNQVVNYDIILFDCSDQERAKRLAGRGQPELANQQMMDWAKYLRENCGGFHKIDSTHLNEQQTLLSLIKILNKE